MIKILGGDSKELNQQNKTKRKSSVEGRKTIFRFFWGATHVFALVCIRARLSIKLYPLNQAIYIYTHPHTHSKIIKGERGLFLNQIIRFEYIYEKRDFLNK